MRCDAEAASYNRESVASSSESVSGSIDFVEIKDDERWLPSASVYFLGNKEQERAGLNVAVLHSKPNTIQLDVIRPGRDVERLLLAEFPRTDRPIPFAMSFDGSGELSVTVGSARAVLALSSFKVEEIMLTCSTSRVDFEIDSGAVQAFGRADQAIRNELEINCDADPAFAVFEDIVNLRSAVQGLIEFVQVKEHERYFPAASVYFLGSRDHERAGIMVSVSPQEPDTISLSMFQPSRNAQRVFLAELPNPHAPIPFEISFNESGELSLLVAGHSESEDFRSFDVEQILVNCSTSEVDFTIIQEM